MTDPKKGADRKDVKKNVERDSSDPHEVQEEAKRLHPNEDARTQEARDNPLEREFEADEHELDGLERQHRPLTDAEDNAEVNRLEGDGAEHLAEHGVGAKGSQGTRRVFVRRAAPARDYLVSATTLRNFFVASGIIGTLVVVVILTLASANDSARYTPADETQYQRTLTQATEALSGFAVAEGDGQTARIPIEQAMAVLAAQGLEAVDASLAGAPAEIAPSEPDPQDAVASPDDEADQEAEEEAEAPAQAEADEPEDTLDTVEGAPADTPEVLTAGQAAYEANCASCHQADGQGVAGAFPPVAGHSAALYNAEGGRPYLINLLLYGLQGEIQVQGETYNGVMPPWQQLPDQDIADILNYVVTEWDGNRQLQDFTPFEAAEVAELRAETLTGTDVYALRQELGLSGDE